MMRMVVIINHINNNIGGRLRDLQLTCNLVVKTWPMTRLYLELNIAKDLQQSKKKKKKMMPSR